MLDRVANYLAWQVSTETTTRLQEEGQAMTDPSGAKFYVISLDKAVRYSILNGEATVEGIAAGRWKVDFAYLTDEQYDAYSQKKWQKVGYIMGIGAGPNVGGLITERLRMYFEEKADGHVPLLAMTHTRVPNREDPQADGKKWPLQQVCMVIGIRGVKPDNFEQLERVLGTKDAKEPVPIHLGQITVEAHGLGKQLWSNHMHIARIKSVFFIDNLNLNETDTVYKNLLQCGLKEKDIDALMSTRIYPPGEMPGKRFWVVLTGFMERNIDTFKLASLCRTAEVVKVKRTHGMPTHHLALATLQEGAKQKQRAHAIMYGTGNSSQYSQGHREVSLDKANRFQAGAGKAWEKATVGQQPEQGPKMASQDILGKLEKQVEEARKQAEEARKQAEEARKQAEEARNQAEEAWKQAGEAWKQVVEARARESRVDMRIDKLVQMVEMMMRGVAQTPTRAIPGMEAVGASKQVVSPEVDMSMTQRDEEITCENVVTASTQATILTAEVMDLTGEENKVTRAPVQTSNNDTFVSIPTDGIRLIAQAKKGAFRVRKSADALATSLKAKANFTLQVELKEVIVKPTATNGTCFLSATVLAEQYSKIPQGERASRELGIPDQAAMVDHCNRTVARAMDAVMNDEGLSDAKKLELLGSIRNLDRACRENVGLPANKWTKDTLFAYWNTAKCRLWRKEANSQKLILTKLAGLRDKELLFTMQELEEAMDPNATDIIADAAGQHYEVMLFPVNIDSPYLSALVTQMTVETQG
jgi:hypothetical protein